MYLEVYKASYIYPLFFIIFCGIELCGLWNHQVTVDGAYDIYKHVTSLYISNFQEGIGESNYFFSIPAKAMVPKSICLNTR